MIRSENIYSAYGPKDVLHGITLSAMPGELIALVGPNGSGKSTCIKTLCGLQPPRTGRVFLNDQDIHSLSAKVRARQISYLPQNRIAPPAMTVRDIIELGRAPWRGRLGQISQAGQAAIKEAIDKTQLDTFIDSRFDKLSGGEQARVLLARALAVKADAIFADEPIAALDPYYQITMLDILKAEATENKTVVVALHDLNLAKQFADRVWVMNHGRLVKDSDPDQALSQETLANVFKIEMSATGIQAI